MADDTALLYRRVGKGGICEVPGGKKGPRKVSINLVIGTLTPSMDGTPEIKCEDENVLNSGWNRQEWWRGPLPLGTPLPLPAP